MAKRTDGKGKLIEVGVARGVKRKKVQRSLRCELSYEEQRTKGLEMAEAMSLLREVEEAKAAAMKGFKDTIDGHLGRAGALAQELRQGWVTRPIECEQVLDYTEGKVIIRRGDTMETIDERAMTEEERQVSFFEEEEVALKEHSGGEGAATD